METIKGQQCHLCGKKTLELREEEKDIPHFGKVFLFSMHCGSCKFSKSDVESQEQREPVKITITVDSEKDMEIRVVKSSNACVKISQMRMSMEPGPASDGFISNIEGLLGKFEKIIEEQRDSSEDPAVKKKAKNLLKKLRKVKFGDVPLKIVIEDPSGNSAIISEKAQVSKLK